MEKILSIIIPTYNMEKYLRYCLDSLLINNNFDRLEILVINDGSKDSSSEIAHEYETRFPNVFKVIDKENGNYGSCINKGLAIATGKYVKVLDADDSFDTENFEDFVSYLMEIDADLVLSDYVMVDEARRITGHRRYGFPVSKCQNMSDICCSDSFKDMQMHAVTYRLSNLIRMGYQQSEGISYTDQQWIFLPMISVKTVYSFDKYVYKYLLGRSGQTMAPEVRVKSLNHLMTCMLRMVDSYNTCCDVVDKCIEDYLLSRLIPQIKDIYITSFSFYDIPTKIKLLDFDKKIKQRNVRIYDRVEATNAKFNYIRFIRKHDKIPPLLIKLMTNIYLNSY